MSTADDDPGPLVRPYAVTRGRVARRGLRELDITTLVSAVGVPADLGALDPEYREILRLCAEHPLSIAELSAHTRLFVSAVKVLVGDLVDTGRLTLHAPAPTPAADLDLLRAVLAGIRRL
ncbi:DUF742 domain-containing protein [Nocardia sp. NPDC003482]